MKEWEKPQLVVLTRSKPEEAVLGWCKEFEIGAGPNAGYLPYGCHVATSLPCADCAGYTFS